MEKLLKVIALYIMRMLEKISATLKKWKKGILNLLILWLVEHPVKISVYREPEKEQCGNAKTAIRNIIR